MNKLNGWQRIGILISIAAMIPYLYMIITNLYYEYPHTRSYESWVNSRTALWDLDQEDIDLIKRCAHGDVHQTITFCLKSKFNSDNIKTNKIIEIALASYAPQKGYNIYLKNIRVRRNSVIASFITHKLSLAPLISLFVYLISFTLVKIYLWVRTGFSMANRGSK
jgi:hypothetical protein